MDGVVVLAAERDEPVEIGTAVVLPPGDVMDVAVLEADGAAGEGTHRVESAQSAALRAVRQPSRPPDVQLAVGVDDRAVADDHRMQVGPMQDEVQDLIRKLHGVTPVDHRPTGRRVDGGGVDHDHDFGAASPLALAVGQRHPRVGAEESLAFHRVRRAALRRGITEQRVHGGGQPVVQGQTRLRVEPAGQAPHPLPVDPLRQPGRSALTLQAS
jgi:hypothetical protein